MADMILVRDAAEKWGLSERRVASLCASGMIEGALRKGHVWMIPSDAQRPVDGRLKEQKNLHLSSDMLRLPVGIIDYREIIDNGYYYVDKTLFIKDFIDELPKVVLFTRPRRFGKTMMMNMLKTFFEKSDENTSRYFEKQKIWGCGKKYRDYQGRYPVIFISFKDVKKNSWKETYESICNLIVNEFIRHSKISCSPLVSRKDFYSRIVGYKADRDDYEMSLKMLSQMLNEYYGIPPVIIIDEYDIPIHQGYLKGFYDEIISFMRNFFSGAFKDNLNLSYGFMTGILRVAKESILSGLNNLKVVSLLDKKYSRYFGFTSEEVRAMAVYYGKEDKIDEICRWYDGFRFGSDHIFNPWSVICYFDNNCEARPYWQATGSNEIIREIIRGADREVMENLSSIVNGKSVMTMIDADVVYPQIKSDPSTIYSFLLMTGYLKAEDPVISPSGDYLCNISIPNKEINYVYSKEILSALKDYFPATSVSGIQSALLCGDAVQLQKQLAKLLIQSVSYYDSAGESFYHGLVLGLCALSGDYFLTSNRELGNGRFDIQMMPQKKNLPGIIIELKAADEPENLKRLADSVLQQIDEKKYDTQMKSMGITKIVKYGIAFCAKDVEMKRTMD